MTYFFSKKWSKKVDFLKPAVIKHRAWKTLNIVSTLAIVLNTGLIGGLIKPATAQANPPPGWDKSSLSFNDDYGCHGSCTEVKAKICNTGDHNMQGTSTYEVYYSPSGNPQSGTVVASGTINALEKNHCQDLTYNPNNIEGNYKFKAYQRPGHPGEGSIWSNTCEVNQCVQPGSISGYKFDDKDGNGVWDTGEPALPNWTIKATKGDVVILKVTDANGQYLFGPFLPEDVGTWIISEVQQDGWVQTFPAEKTYSIYVESGTGQGDSYALYNFGNHAGQCELTIVKSVNKESAKPGDTLTYTIKYKNIGAAVCTGTAVKIYDKLDSHLSYQNGSATIDDPAKDLDHDGITYTGNVSGTTELANAHRVSPGESGTITLNAKVKDDIACNVTEIPNKAKIWSTQTGKINSNEVKTEVTFDLDDHNVCTTDICNEQTGQIEHNAISIDDGNACTTDVCDPTTGDVTHTPVNVDDSNACTVDSCNEKTGEISHDPVDTNDDDACTVDQCDVETGEISHSPVNVDDQNVCTTDQCNQETGEITHSAISTDDDNACTIDSCDPITGVSNTLVNVDDGNACTTDSCNPETGEVSNAAVNTDDGNICTDDSCNKETGVISHDYNENICPLPGKISGYKYDWSTEQRLNGWEICLGKISIEPEKICVKYVKTGDPEKEWSKGYYEFNNLTPGTYKVWEKTQDGWTQMEPTIPTNYFTIPISSGTNSQGNDFWNRKNEFNVTMTKKVDKELVEAGENLTYELKWTLTGNTPAQVKIFDALPANTTFVSATDSGILDGSTVKWDLGTKTPAAEGPAAEGFVYFTVKVNTPYPEKVEKTISNTARWLQNSFR